VFLPLTETMDHLFHCEIANASRSDIFNRFSLAWVMPRTVVDPFAYWGGLGGYPQNAVV
jgi:hypothetical protein